MPTLHHLKIFIEVAKHGKMSEAAQKLYLSQPTISQAISVMEDHYKIMLFERLAKKLYLTEQGKILFEEAKKVVAQYERLEDVMHEISDTYTVKIGASATAGVFLAHKVIDNLQNEMPEVRIKVFSYSAKYIESNLNNNELDIALMEYQIDNPDIISIPVFDDHLSLVCGKDHKFYNRDFIEKHELEGEVFVFQDMSIVAMQTIQSFLHTNNINVKNDWICNNVESAKAAAINNRGLLLISDLLTMSECEYNTLKRIPIKGETFTRNVYLVYHKDKYLGKALKRLIDICKKMQ